MHGDLWAAGRAPGAAEAAVALGWQSIPTIEAPVASLHRLPCNRLAYYRDRRGILGWADLERSVTAAVQPATAAAQPDANELHIFLALGGRRAYLACGRTAGRFAAVAVEEEEEAAAG